MDRYQQVPKPKLTRPAYSARSCSGTRPGRPRTLDVEELHGRFGVLPSGKFTNGRRGLAHLDIAQGKGPSMNRTSIRLAAVALTTTAGMLVAPVAAAALTPTGTPISDSPASARSMKADLGTAAKMTCQPGMAAKMKGHPSMAAAIRAHPEMAKMMAKMMKADPGMAAKMKGHPSMAAAMRAHPEMAKMMKAACGV
jgi:hypothetical protein